jgi:hypothetical protein
MVFLCNNVCIEVCNHGVNGKRFQIFQLVVAHRFSHMHHIKLGFVWSIYLCRKVVCLFVSMRSTELGCFRLRSWLLWKALEEEGCFGLVSWCLDLQCKKFLNIE